METKQALIKVLNSLNQNIGMWIKCSRISITKLCRDLELQKVYQDKLMKALVDKGLMEFRGGGAGREFKVTSDLSIEGLETEILNYQLPTRSEAKSQRLKKEIKDKAVPKRYNLGDEVYFIYDNKITKGVIVCMRYDGGIEDQIKSIKNNNIEYSIMIDKLKSTKAFKVTEFSNNIDGLLSLLKYNFNSKS